MGRSIVLCSTILVIFIAFYSATQSEAGLLSSPWPSFRHDALHTGRCAYAGPKSGAVEWNIAIGGPGTVSPAIGDCIIYTVGMGNLIALDLSGNIVWSAPCGNNGSSSPAVASNGTVYIASTDSYLYAFNPDGSLKWRRTIQGATEASPTLGPDDTIYIGSTSKKLFAYRSDGTLKFSYTAGGAIASSVALAPDGTIYFGCDDGCLYALNSAGALKWKFVTNPLSAIKGSPSIGSDGTVYFGSSAGYFYAVWPAGTQRWRFIAGGGIVSSPALGADGSIYFGCRDGALYCLSPTGSLKWRTFTGAYVDSSPAVDSLGIVYFGSNNGFVYAVGPSGDIIWQTRIGTAVTSSPAIGDNALYALSRDGVLYAFGSDRTPPPAPIVTDDGAFSSSSDTLHASWTCSDPESGISRYEYAIRNSSGIEIVPFTDVGTATEVIRTDLQLSHGETYYFVVRALNGAQLASEEGISDGILVDLTAPTVTELNASMSIQEVRARVDADDPESGITQVQCTLLTSSEIPAVPNWVSGIPGQEVVFPGPFDSSSVFYVAARVLNGAGTWSQPTVSGPLRIDNTPPTTPVVTDDGVYWTNTSNLHASWISQDPESGIDHYTYCVGTTPNSSDIIPWTDTVETSIILTGLSLINGQTYYFTVRAVNRAGLVSDVGFSDGIKVDSTPPSQPVVNDGGETTPSPDCLHFTVSSTDAESGIAGYIYRVGTSPGADDVVPDIAVGNQSSVTVCSLRLQEGVRYYVSVKAKNGAGLESAFGTSDGIEYRPSAWVWRKFRFDSRNSGCAPVRAPASGRLFWRVQTNGYVESSAAVGSDSAIYIGSADGKLYAISSVGTVKWTYDTGTCVDSSPAIGPDGCIYFGSYDGFYCVSPAGTLKWKYTTGSMVWSSPNIAPDGTIYFGCQNHRFYALDSNGNLKWMRLTGGAIWSSPAIASDGSIYFGCGDGKLYAMTQEGVIKWTYQTGSAVDSSPTIAEDGSIYFGSGDGYIYSLSPLGNLRWRAYLGQVADSSPAVTADGRIYVGSGMPGFAGALHAFSQTGTKLWQFNVSGGVRSSPAVDENGNICFGSSNGKIYLLSRDGVELWSYSTGDSILSSPTFGAGGSIIVGSDDGGIYCFRDYGALDNTPPTTPTVHVAHQFISPDAALEASWSASDPESGIRAYLYAIGTEPGADDVVAWTNVGTTTFVSRSNLPLLMGRSYYVSVKAINHALLESAVGVSGPITIVAGSQSNMIGWAKRRLPGTQVNLPGKIVTAVFSDCVFIEEPNRSAAIRCQVSSAGLEPGMVVSVTGTVGLRYGEIVLYSVDITPSGFRANILPVGMACETMMKVGLDVTAMLVRIAGKVTRTGSGWCVIDDGSYLLSPRGGRGIEVQFASGSPPPAESYVAVTGIVCRELVGSRFATIIRALPGSECTIYPRPFQ